MLLRTLVFLQIIMLPWVTVAGLFGPSNFEECMVEKMRGQPSNMYGDVYQLCKKRFPIKEPKKSRVHPKTDELQYTWHQSALTTSIFEPSKAYIAIKITRNKTGYKLTDFVGTFSEKECAVSADTDFKYTVPFEVSELSLTPNEESASAHNETGRTYKCVRLTEFYGYK